MTRSTFAAPTRFGAFGGAFAPETLMASLLELEAAWLTARDDPAFRDELGGLFATYAGRPTPLTHARRLSDELGLEVWLKREDLLHTGAHKLNNSLGQALLAKRMGKTRILAETGAGQHGVATATVCALLGLECVVYMGKVDAERQHPNVLRMELLGARVELVEQGQATLKDAINEALRAWVSDPSAHYLLGSALGPHPFPGVVADFQSVIGEEAHRQWRQRGPRLSRDRTGARRAARERARPLRLLHRRRGPARVRGARPLRGDPPRAGEQPRARLGDDRARGSRRPARPDQPVRTRRQGPRHRGPPARNGAMSENRLEQRLAGLRAEGRTGLAPYVTAGDGGLDTTFAILRAADACGAACVELGVPFTDPIADGPVLQAAANRALEAGTTLRGIFGLVAKLRRAGSELPIALFSYANPLVRLGWKEAAERSAEAGVDAWLVPDLVPEEAEEMRGAALEHGIAPIFFVAPTSSPERIAAAAAASRGFLYAIGRVGVTGSRTELDAATLDFLATVRAAAGDLPLAVGFGLSTANQVAAVTQHADLAIVGSAFVQRIRRTFDRAGHFTGAAAEEAIAYLHELSTGLRR